MKLIREARHVTAAARRLRSGVAVGAAGDDETSVVLRGIVAKFRDRVDAAQAGDGSVRERRAEGMAAVAELRRELVALKGRAAAHHAELAECARFLSNEIVRIETKLCTPVAMVRMQKRAAAIEATFARDPNGLREHVLRAIDSGDTIEVLACTLVDGASRTAALGMAVLANKQGFQGLVETAPTAARTLAAVAHTEQALAEIEAAIAHDNDQLFAVPLADGRDLVEAANDGLDLLPKLGLQPVDAQPVIRALFEIPTSDRVPELGAQTAAPTEPTDAEGAA